MAVLSVLLGQSTTSVSKKPHHLEAFSGGFATVRHLVEGWNDFGTFFQNDKNGFKLCFQTAALFVYFELLTQFLQKKKSLNEQQHSYQKYVVCFYLLPGFGRLSTSLGGIWNPAINKNK
jgi:hypothetical protein